VDAEGVVAGLRRDARKSVHFPSRRQGNGQ
jgi:hypothetical protein